MSVPFRSLSSRNKRKGTKELSVSTLSAVESKIGIEKVMIELLHLKKFN